MKFHSISFHFIQYFYFNMLVSCFLIDQVRLSPAHHEVHVHCGTQHFTKQHNGCCDPFNLFKQHVADLQRTIKSRTLLILSPTGAGGGGGLKTFFFYWKKIQTWCKHNKSTFELWCSFVNTVFTLQWSNVILSQGNIISRCCSKAKKAMFVFYWMILCNFFLCDFLLFIFPSSSVF